MEIRAGRAADAEQIAANDRRAFGDAKLSIQKLADRVARHFVPDEFVVAVDGGRVVANLATWPFRLTLPGLGRVPVGGITWAAVSPTHRRRGLLRTLLEQATEDARGMGWPALVLTASEGAIYRRLGYGAASTQRLSVIDARRAVFRDPPASGWVDVVDDSELERVLPAVFERFAARAVGQIDRSDRTWRRLLDQPDGPTPFTVVHRDRRGRADGFARYVTDSAWNDGNPGFDVRVSDFAAGTADAHAGLWHHLLSLDLVATVTSWHVPLDDPLPHLLTDHRQVGTSRVIDNLWVRVLDVAGLFGARTYSIADDVVIEVLGDDAVVAGRWRIVGGPDGAEVTRTRRTPAVTMPLDALGAISLGGTSPVVLARAGWIEERRSGAAARLARFVRTEPAPLCSTPF